MPAPSRFSLRRLQSHPESAADAAVRLAQHARSRGATRLVVPVNGQVFVIAGEHPELASVLHRAEDILLDGISVYVGSRLLGKTGSHRATGVDLMANLCRESAPHGTRVLLLGGRPGSADRVREQFRFTHRGLVVRTMCPPPGFEHSPEQVAEIRAAIAEFQPGIVFVALGAPKQELFMDSHLRDLQVPVVMAVGGSFEMLSGAVRRAPGWVQRVGMEWFYRLAGEPRRLFWRYAYTNTMFLARLALELTTPVSRKQDAEADRARETAALLHRKLG